MQLACPVCRARFRGARFCSRCGADLGPLMWIATRAWRLREQSRETLAAGDWPTAADLADEASRLHSSPQSEALRMVTEWIASNSDPAP